MFEIGASVAVHFRWDMMGEPGKKMGKYELNCTDCSFNVEFDGSVDDVLDRIDEHQADMKSDPLIHFVNFDRVNGAE